MNPITPPMRLLPNKFAYEWTRISYFALSETIVIGMTVQSFVTPFNFGKLWRI